MATLERLFGRSPFGALQEHMYIVKKCVNLIIPFFEAEISGDKGKAKTIAQQIFDLEDKADDVKNTLRDNLPRSLFMPISRHDLLEMLHIQDQIADTAQDISTILTLRHLTIPDNIVADLREYVDSSIKVCYMAVEISERFDKLLDASFLGTEAQRVLGMITELNKLERENDQAGLNLAHKIVVIEKELTPVEVFLWFKLSDLIGNLADYAQKMANLMRLTIAK